MKRPFEVQHIIDFIEGGGVTQYSQSQMMAMTEHIEQLEARVAALEEVERLARVVMDASWLDDSDGHAPNPAISATAMSDWEAICKLLGVWDEEREA